MPSGDDPFAELADIFMTTATEREHDREMSEPIEPPSAPPTTVELLVIGHLPVRAALWLTPYADAVARDEGASALLRLDGDETMVQVLGGPADALLPDACRTLPETINRLRRTIGHWIIRPSARTPMRDLLASGAGRLTILGSADQVAVLNTWQLVKEVVETARRAGLPLPELGLAVIGSDSAGARLVADRINHTARDQLGLEIPLVRTLRRMDATIRASGLRSFPGQARPELQQVMEWIGVSESAVDTDDTVEAAPEPIDSFVPPLDETPIPEAETPSVPPALEPSFEPTFESAVEPVAEPTIEPAIDRPVPAAPLSRDPLGAPPTPRVASMTSSVPAPLVPVPPAPAPPVPPARRDPPMVETFGVRTPEATADLTPRRVIKLDAKAPREVEAKDPVRATEPSADGAPVALAANVAGLRSIRPRCPGHERVELALDDTGTLHLLVREDSVRELAIVESWAHAHRELLVMACPDDHFASGGRPQLHLFTDTPRNVADLYGTSYHLHLLTQVEVNGQVGWYSTEL